MSDCTLTIMSVSSDTRGRPTAIAVSMPAHSVPFGFGLAGLVSGRFRELARTEWIGDGHFAGREQAQELVELGDHFRLVDGSALLDRNGGSVPQDDSRSVDVARRDTLTRVSYPDSGSSYPFGAFVTVADDWFPMTTPLLSATCSTLMLLSRSPLFAH